MAGKPHSREKKTRKLKENVIQMIPQEEAELSEKYEGLKRRKIRIVVVRGIVISAILFGIFFAWKYYNTYHLFESYETVWSQELLEGASSSFVTFEDNVLKYTKDGVSYLNGAGTVVWNQTYEMKNPIAAVNSSYAAIADQRGNSILICNKEGASDIITTVLPILKITVSSQGIVAVILEDTTSSLIEFYTYDGRNLVDMKASLAGSSGYPLDISLSPDGTQLMVSYIYLANGILQNHVVFYNFSEKGKSLTDHLVGYHSSENSTIIPKVQFLTNESACAFGDSDLEFYSLKNELSPEKIKTKVITGEIESIFYNSHYVGIIVAGEEAAQYTLQVFDVTGNEVFKVSSDFEYRKVEFGRNTVMLWNSTECMIYNMNGVVKYSGAFDSEIVQMDESREAWNFIIISSQEMKRIKLK